MQQGQMLAGFAALRARRAQGAPPRRKKKKPVPGQAGGKPPLGSGQRFDQLAASLANRPGVQNPNALAAAIGRKKFGAQKMGQLSARGKPGY